MKYTLAAFAGVLLVTIGGIQLEKTETYQAEEPVIEEEQDVVDQAQEDLDRINQELDAEVIRIEGEIEERNARLDQIAEMRSSF